MTHTCEIQFTKTFTMHCRSRQQAIHTGDGTVQCQHISMPGPLHVQTGVFGLKHIASLVVVYVRTENYMWIWINVELVHGVNYVCTSPNSVKLYSIHGHESGGVLQSTVNSPSCSRGPGHRRGGMPLGWEQSPGTPDVPERLRQDVVEDGLSKQ